MKICYNSEDMENADLVIVNVTGAERGMAIRTAMTSKVPFALDGIEFETAEQLNHLARNAKKNHVKCCWLGSFRFLRAFAKLKEIISGGTAGKVSVLTIHVSGPSKYRTSAEDAAQWLADGIDCTPKIEFEEKSRLEARVCVAAENARAELILGNDQKSSLTIDFVHRHRRTYEYQEDFQTEFKYLKSTFTHNNFWNALPQIQQQKQKGKGK